MKKQPTSGIQNLKCKMFIVFALLSLFHNSNAIDLESAKEQTCLPIKKTVEVDFKWMMSVKEWYYPLMSRLDLYLSCLELSGNTEDPSKLRESQIFYESCFKAEFIGQSAISIGFNGKSSPFSFDLPTTAENGVTSQRFIAESGMGMTAYTTLTDNASYIFMAVCWDDNQATWGVMSTVPKLPKETIKQIYEHAESLGFKKEFFEELRYDSCYDDRDNTISAQGKETCAK